MPAVYIIPFFGLLFVNGVILGLCFIHKPLLGGLAVVRVFPVALSANVMVFGFAKRHNLWPFEVAEYLFLGLLPALGSYLSQRWIRKDKLVKFWW